MSAKNSFWTVGYIKEIYATQTYGNFRKREFVVRNVFRKNNKWHVTDIKFVATGDSINDLELLEPGKEVIVHFRIRSNYYKKNGDFVIDEKGHKVLFLELNAWKVFSHTDRIKDKEDPIWALEDYQEVKKNEDFENEDSLINQEKKRKRPESKSYSVDNFLPTTDYSDKEDSVDSDDDDLPF